MDGAYRAVGLVDDATDRKTVGGGFTPSAFVAHRARMIGSRGRRAARRHLLQLLRRTVSLPTRTALAVRSSRARWLLPFAMCAVLVGTCALYFRALDSVPAVVSVDEARFA